MHAKLVGLRLPWPVCPEDQLCIEAEPDNEYDANALKVLVHLNGKWHMVGYVNREAAAELKDKTVSSVRALIAGDGWTVPINIEC